jgi:hypothetical protein
MNKLHRNLKLQKYVKITTGVCFAMLGLMALLRNVLGLEEQEFYEKYPAGWWAVVALGFTFLASLVYAAKKTADTHPNIQLRSKSDEVLENVLADPEYELWHHEAQRLLDHRKEGRGNPKPEVPRWISWPLIGLMYALLALVLIIIIGATIAFLVDNK